MFLDGWNWKYIIYVVETTYFSMGKKWFIIIIIIVVVVVVVVVVV
jgi:hypothetical protein